VQASQTLSGMTLRDHLNELRKRLFIVVIAVVLASIAAFVYREYVMDFLLAPAHGFGGAPDDKPIYTEPAEMIGVTIKVSLMPGLTRREKTYLFAFLPGLLLAFGLGVAFGYYVMFPPALSFLFSFGTETATPQIRIAPYINLITSLLFWVGLIFELPLVMFLLARLGVVSSRWLARYRRHAVVVAFIAGAIITPTPDPLNQALVALPIMVLYEVGIWLAKLAERLRRSVKAEKEAGAEEPAE
jgi:sec-independent protein translocase protein TatC